MQLLPEETRQILIRRNLKAQISKNKGPILLSFNILIVGVILFLALSNMFQGYTYQLGQDILKSDKTGIYLNDIKLASVYLDAHSNEVVYINNEPYLNGNKMALLAQPFKYSLWILWGAVLLAFLVSYNWYRRIIGRAKIEANKTIEEEART